MDVEATQRGRIQHPLRQDQAIRSDHHHIGVCVVNRLLGGCCIVGEFTIQAQTAWLRYKHAVLQGQLLDRRGLQLHAPTRRPVGLGQHQGHRVARRMDAGQSHCRKFGRARKNNAHRHVFIRRRAAL